MMSKKNSSNKPEDIYGPVNPYTPDAGDRLRALGAEDTQACLAQALGYPAEALRVVRGFRGSDPVCILFGHFLNPGAVYSSRSAGGIRMLAGKAADVAARESLLAELTREARKYSLHFADHAFTLIAGGKTVGSGFSPYIDPAIIHDAGLTGRLENLVCEAMDCLSPDFQKKYVVTVLPAEKSLYYPGKSVSVVLLKREHCQGGEILLQDGLLELACAFVDMLGAAGCDAPEAFDPITRTMVRADSAYLRRYYSWLTAGNSDVGGKLAVRLSADEKIRLGSVAAGRNMTAEALVRDWIAALEPDAAKAEPAVPAGEGASPVATDIRRKRGRPRKRPDDETLAWLCGELPTKEIAEIYGVATATVRSWASKIRRDEAAGTD